MTAPPARSSLFPVGSLSPANAKTYWAAFYDYVTEQLGMTGGAPTAIASINGGPLAGNRIKNGNKLVAQRGTSGTVVAGTTVPTASSGYYTVDRFYSYCTGASVAVAQVAGSDATNKRTQYTGAASVTAIGDGTRLEASEIAHMAGQTCTYSVELANSLLTTVTWTAYYATTADAFGTIGTPTKTQIATGTFTVNSTVTKYSVQIAIPAGATTGIEIVKTVGAQTSGTWTIGREDLRLGSVSPTYFEVPDIDDTLRKCQRYGYKQQGTYFLRTGGFSSAQNFIQSQSFPVTMRATPAVIIGTPSYSVNSSVGNAITASTEMINWNVNCVSTGDVQASWSGYAFWAEIP